jgi:hypothetical protein
VATKSKNAFRIHLGLVVAELICIPAFIFETIRALSGNLLSWAYVIEWPLLAGYAVYMWRKMLQDVHAEEQPAPSVAQSAPAPLPDPELDAWNDYLRSVHQRKAP